MAELYYRDALKLGQKEYRACASSGRYPYLPVLDDFIPAERSTAGIDLGLLSVPEEFIVGTKTRARTNAFAANFMPILPEGTEFSQKWDLLCRSHLEEGIREPVKLYEYLNRYYVEEGNKRVSVLKFFDAVSIPAHVIRLMPQDPDTPEARLYRELLSFSRLSGIRFFELSERGGYARLNDALGKKDGETWTEEERSRFTSAYYSFKSAYAASGGARLSATVGDAMLSFIEVYGYDALCEGSAAELKKGITGMWEEVRLKQESAPVELKTAPAEEKKAGLLRRVLPAVQPLRAAFLYDRDPESSAWAYGHEQGRLHAEKVFGGRVLTRAYGGVMWEDAQQCIERAIAEGSTVLFTTSPRMLSASLQAAVRHPEVIIMNCSLNQSHRYIRTYYARAYEAKFIIGAIAGAMAGGREIGYICDYPIFGQVASINAFALGAQLTDPGARVVLEWSATEGSEAARRRLEARGIRVISFQDFSRQSDGQLGKVGLVERKDDGARLLAAPLWKWDVYYEELLRSIINRTAQSEYAGSTRALNYYWGMSAGVVDVAPADELPDGVKKLAQILKRSIVQEDSSPFMYPLRTRSGEDVGGEGDRLGPEAIMNMDYLVDNVEGSIPVYDEISDMARPTVDAMGVEPSTRQKAPERKEAGGKD